MPPPEKPLPLPLPRPKPKPPKPKLPKPERKLKPKPKPQPEPERDQIPFGVPLPPDPFACAADCSESCAYYHLCPPPPPPSSRAATVHLRSSRLPTPLIALSASLLVVSVILLIALLVYRMVRHRRRQTAPQEAPLTQHEEEGVPVPDVAVEGEDAGDSGVHHVWYIRTVGLDERAIAAITALVYDAKKCGGGVGLGRGGDDGSCAVCLAEFRDGETLRLLPRCGHAFHRGCIDTWLSAHVNCPLCRAPVQVADQAASANAALGAATAAPGSEPAANHLAAGGAGTEEADGDGAMPERAVRRAASMVTLPRRAWPGVSLRASASNSGREGEMSLAKISRQLKFSEALEMAGIGAGRSFSFGAASCLRLPGRYGPSAAGINTDEMSR